MRARWFALAAVSLSVLAVSLDGTVLSVALPTLARELHASQSDLVWFSAGYLLVLAATSLPAGLIGDRYGRKRVMLGSLVLFGVGSAMCAYASSVGVFLAGRLVQGVAGSGITVMALSALVVLFSEPERPRAVGVYQAANFLALPLGPLLGGWMLAHFWWGWVFLINVPVVLIAFVAGLILVPESRAERRPGLDPVGTAASTLGLVLLVYGLVRASDRGWGDPAVPVTLAAGVIFLIGFAAWERRVEQPLISPALFRSGPFVWGAVLAAIAGLAMIGVLFTLPQYFQGVRGVDTLGSGLRLLPLIVGMVAGAGLARVLSARVTTVAGFALLALGLLAGARTGVDSGDAYVAAWSGLVGLGTGLTLTASTSVALSGLTAERSGTASAVLQALTKTAGPFGTAIMGSVLAAVYRSHLGSSAAIGAGSGDAARHAFVSGLSAALLVSAAIAVAGAVAAAVFLPSPRPVPQEAAGAVTG